MKKHESDALRIKMDILFLTDRGRTYNRSDGDVASRFREYRPLLSRKKENRDAWERRHMSVRLTCYQLSGALNGSVHCLVSKLTNGPFMTGGGDIMLILGNTTSADKKDPPWFFAISVDNRAFQSLRGSN